MRNLTWMGWGLDIIAELYTEEGKSEQHLQPYDLIDIQEGLQHSVQAMN